MIQKFVEKWEKNKHKVETAFRDKHPGSYNDIVKNVVTIMADDYYDYPDPERITIIDDGNYQGTLLFIIGAAGYQPDKYWAVKVSYGSCSGCDTLERIRCYDDGKPNDEQVADYMTLALHIVQEMKEI